MAPASRRAEERVPRPGPISTMRSSGLTSARVSDFLTMFLSMRKFWPSFFLG